MRDPIYYCGDLDADAPRVSRRERALAQIARMETCEHPESFREPIRGQIRDLSCSLCGASQQRIVAQRRLHHDDQV